MIEVLWCQVAESTKRQKGRRRCRRQVYQKSQTTPKWAKRWRKGKSGLAEICVTPFLLSLTELYFIQQRKLILSVPWHQSIFTCEYLLDIIAMRKLNVLDWLIFYCLVDKEIWNSIFVYIFYIVLWYQTFFIVLLINSTYIVQVFM